MHTVEDQLAENSKLDPEIAQQTQQRLDNMSLFRFPQADDNVSSIRHPNPFDDDDLNLPKKQSVEEQLAARSKLDPEIAQHTQQQLSNAKLISIIHPNPFDDDINLPKQFVDDQLAEGSKLDLGIADHTQHQLDNVPLRKIRRRVARQKREWNGNQSQKAFKKKRKPLHNSIYKKKKTDFRFVLFVKKKKNSKHQYDVNEQEGGRGGFYFLKIDNTDQQNLWLWAPSRQFLMRNSMAFTLYI